MDGMIRNWGGESLIVAEKCMCRRQAKAAERGKTRKINGEDMAEVEGSLAC